MAKQKLVAKVRFDDGSKKGEDGKSRDYEVGEAYMGSDPKAALDKGFLCSESDLKASKEVLDAKDKMIRELQEKNADLNKQLDEANKKLAGGDDDDGAPAKPKPKRTKKGAAPAAPESEQE